MSDIVIIGTGIQGLSSAYNISMEKNFTITIVESNLSPGKESSSRSGAMLMKSRENKLKIQLSLYSFERFLNFDNEFNESLVFRKTGFLSVITSPMVKRYEKEYQTRLKMGIEPQKLNPQEISKIAPGIKNDDLEFGILGLDDGEIQPEQLIRVFEKKSRELGVNISYGETAIDIILKNNKVIGVKTNKRTIPCEIVVNAGGANAREIASWVSLKLPITNTLRSLYVVKTESNLFDSGPMVEDAELEWYYRPLGKQKVLIGMGLEENGLILDVPNVEFLPKIIKASKFRAPSLYPFKVLSGVSGIRPLTPDRLPILGPVEQINGFYNSCGWGGEGIMHSPAGGTIISDWINNTNNYYYNKQDFLLSRFH
ncbi:MAG TPA: FAD-dependent oxidoreductase [Saprospiraceae bacterium]|nr:FAD-dependent oxidoreductase [Saprospiraceae bacterium]